MNLAPYTEPIDKLLLNAKFSIYYRPWVKVGDKYDFTREHWCAIKFVGRNEIEGIGDTPRDAVIALYKKLQ
jgi:hypothetical protein